MTKHSWKFQQTMNSGPNELGNDQPCFQWYCARCDTMAMTFGDYESKEDPEEPTSKNCKGLPDDCNVQVVINIMDT